MLDAPDSPLPYRLRGLVDNVEKSFHLEPGSHQVGSSRTNDIVLPVRGISREHAVLTVSGEGLVVEDQGSLNGSFVDEHRIEQALAPPGCELRFGQVRLRVERLAPADAELAFVIDLPSAASPPPLTEPWLTVDDTTHLGNAGVLASRSSLVFPEAYLVLRSPSMTALYRQMEPLSRSMIPVLILGETGVGKEMFARIVHSSSARHDGPFVAVNCAAIPAELLEAEMFGIGRGVATGVEKRQGRFDMAEGGTLFLDEIGEMAAPLQAKLLRALQEKEIHPLGGRPRKINVRIVAATNAELTERMDQGLFRRDLYYRLAGSVLNVPPLKKVRDDVPRLVEHFLHVFCRETGRRIHGVTVGALDQVTAYDWPGNVRQLENEIRRLVYQSHDGQVLDSSALSDEVRSDPTGAAFRPLAIPLDPLDLEPRIQELESCLIREALRRTDGNQTRAAKLLGITRNGLAKKIKRLELTAPSSQ